MTEMTEIYDGLVGKKEEDMKVKGCNCDLCVGRVWDVFG